MNRKLERFASAVRDYAKFKAQFGRFCEMSMKALNDNQQLPGLSFSVDDDGISAEIRALDQTFVIRFHLVARGVARVRARIGVLAVYLALSEGKETLLWHTFFDGNGHVRETEDAESSSYHLGDKNFLEHLLGEFSDPYFFILIEKFKIGAPPGR